MDKVYEFNYTLLFIAMFDKQKRNCRRILKRKLDGKNFFPISNNFEFLRKPPPRDRQPEEHLILKVASIDRELRNGNLLFVGEEKLEVRMEVVADKKCGNLKRKRNLLRVISRKSKSIKKLICKTTLILNSRTAS